MYLSQAHQLKLNAEAKADPQVMEVICSPGRYFLQVTAYSQDLH